MDHNKLWKILKEMAVPYHLTCLLRNLYAGQEATVKADMEQLAPSWERLYNVALLLTSVQSTLGEMPGRMNH